MDGLRAVAGPAEDKTLENFEKRRREDHELFAASRTRARDPENAAKRGYRRFHLFERRARHERVSRGARTGVFKAFDSLRPLYGRRADLSRYAAHIRVKAH